MSSTAHWVLGKNAQSARLPSTSPGSTYLPLPTMFRKGRFKRTVSHCCLVMKKASDTALRYSHIRDGAIQAAHRELAYDRLVCGIEVSGAAVIHTKPRGLRSACQGCFGWHERGSLGVPSADWMGTPICKHTVGKRAHATLHFDGLSPNLNLDTTLIRRTHSCLSS